MAHRSTHFAILLGTVTILTACLGLDCQDVELQRAASPGGGFEALVSHRDCGALDGSNPIKVEIVEPGGSVGTGTRIAVIDSTRQCAPGKPGVEVRWSDHALELTVSYHSDSNASVTTRYENVMIRYRHCDATYVAPSAPGSTGADDSSSTPNEEKGLPG